MENINEKDLDKVVGGAGNWQDYTHGSYVDYGDHIVYTVVPGDALSGIAARFGVTVWQIQKWNNIWDPNVIEVGQKLTIVPAR